MKNYYFTFHKDDKTSNGEPLVNYYVTVIAANWTRAKILFTRNFLNTVTKSPSAFDKQWHEDYFTDAVRASFKYGEFCCIDESKEIL